MTSLVASSRLQIAMKYCTKVMRKTGQAKFTKCCTDTHADLVYSHTGYYIISYFRSAFIEVRKTTENAASDSFGFFCDAAFCLPHQSVGILLGLYHALRPPAFVFHHKVSGS